MKKLLSVAFLASVLFASIAPAAAADWMSDLRRAIAANDFSEINVIGANNPKAQGKIAMVLLREAQTNIESRPNRAIKLFASAVTFADQIQPNDAPLAGTIVQAMLRTANNPDFQRHNLKGASTIYAVSLGISSGPNMLSTDPKLHNVALSDTSNFMSNHPSVSDPQLKEEVSLALQAGSPPPTGPNGVINVGPVAGSATPIASDWKGDLQKAIAAGNYPEINVIAANNPTALGEIGMTLLRQAQQERMTNPDAATKLFAASVTFADQIQPSDGPAASAAIQDMLSLASTFDFQKQDPKDASTIFAAALTITSNTNIMTANPKLHNLALADASDFMGNNPNVNGLQLSQEVSLALQVGSPPPTGPNGVINAGLTGDWKADLQKAIADGNYQEINVIAANNPTAQADIAMVLLRAAQADIATNPDAAAKLFAASVAFADQIQLSDSAQAGAIVQAMLALANNPTFQQQNPKDASSIFAASLAISSESNIIATDPNLHNAALADAGDFMNNNPSASDPQLSDEVNLALQVGSPPPLGPAGVINPSAE